MSTLTPELLFSRLPALHRIRDAGQGGPLAALLAVAAEQGALVEDDIARLLENLFIETCDEWVLPYLGDLLGVRDLHPLPTGALPVFSQRARVANTLAHRRRKGTAAMLEQLARDTTGWPARAVEFFQLLGWNQNINHVRLGTVRTPDLRRSDALELLDGAFESATRTVDVRRIEPGRGRHNLPSVGLFLWRLQSYFVSDALARPVQNSDRYFTVDPSGREIPLFNRPRTETDVLGLAAERQVPGRLRRRPLHDELQAHRASPATAVLDWFDSASTEARPVFRAYQRPAGSAPSVAFTEIPAAQIAIVHARRLLDTTDLPAYAAEPADHPLPANTILALDPVRGLLRWAGPDPVPELRVASAYGFPGDLGGGPYDRRDSVEEFLRLQAAAPRPLTFQVGVSREKTALSGEQIFPTFADAISAWEAHAAANPGAVGLIALMDSQRYAAGLTVTVPAGTRLLVVAADWPSFDLDGVPTRTLGQFSASGLRPCIQGDITVSAPSAAGQGAGELAFDGVLLDGKLTVAASASGRAADLGLLRLAHCTLVPSAGGLAVPGGNARLAVELVRTITGPVSIPPDAQLPATAVLRLTDSIVDGPGAAFALDAEASPAEIESSSILGRSRLLTLHASDSIFTRLVTVERAQEGCVRFSYVPPLSATGRRFRCQPDLAQAASALDNNDAVAARVRPAFVAETYGDPAYLQLANACPSEIATGAEDGSEMGAWRFLQNPHRVANLRASLEEYLPASLEAGPVFAT
jgi:hypothetical protein